MWIRLNNLARVTLLITTCSQIPATLSMASGRPSSKGKKVSTGQCEEGQQKERGTDQNGSSGPVGTQVASM